MWNNELEGVRKAKPWAQKYTFEVSLNFEVAKMEYSQLQPLQ